MPAPALTERKVLEPLGKETYLKPRGARREGKNRGITSWSNAITTSRDSRDRGVGFFGGLCRKI